VSASSSGLRFDRRRQPGCTVAPTPSLPSSFLPPATVTLPGSRSRISGAGGRRSLGAHPGPVAEAARGRCNPLRPIARLRLSSSASTGTSREVPAAIATQQEEN